MFDQVNHYEFLEQLRPSFYPDHSEMDEDDLLDEERRAEEAERLRDAQLIGEEWVNE